MNPTLERELVEDIIVKSREARSEALRAKRALVARDAAITRAFREGMSERQVASATGLARGALYKIKVKAGLVK